MTANKAYMVHYKMYQSGEVKAVSVLAKNKADAYDKAVYEAIVKEQGSLPYSAWVSSVTYQNGNYKRFNTFEGKPY